MFVFKFDIFLVQLCFSLLRCFTTFIWASATPLLQVAAQRPFCSGSSRLPAASGSVTANIMASGGRFVQTFSQVCVSLQSLQLEHFLQTFFDVLQTLCRLFLTFCRLFADFIWLVNHFHADFLQNLCPGDNFWTDFVHTNSVLGRLFAELMHTNSVQMTNFEQT